MAIRVIIFILLVLIMIGKNIFAYVSGFNARKKAELIPDLKNFILN